jgi:hypothetical protein
VKVILFLCMIKRNSGTSESNYISQAAISSSCGAVASVGLTLSLETL